MSNQKIFSVGDFDFRLQHLLVIGVLALSVSISMLIRATPMTYGLDLFEFDPFFNYRATDYIIQNGYESYLNWVDDKSWHPFGRDISENSQNALHITSAVLYKIFGFGTTLYEFTVYFPLIVGSLTSISVFAFVRVLGGTSSGMIAALMFAISTPIFTRGLAGWFKSEPLGLFFGFLAMYLFVSGIMNYKGKSSLVKLSLAGIFLSLSLSSWGGMLFFVIPIAILFFALPFIKKEKNHLIFSVPIFIISFLIFSSLFERPSSFLIGGHAGILLIFSTVFLLICEVINKLTDKSKQIRNCSIILGGTIMSIVGILVTNIVPLPGFRYLNASNPFLTSVDPLTDSVSEHATTDLAISYSFVSVFIVFGLIGAWFLFSRKTIDIKLDKRIFALIIAITAFYFSSSFVRLEIFASIGLIILGSIGISILSKKLFLSDIFKPTKFLYVGVIILLFIIPITMPENTNWLSWADFKPTIYNGGTYFSVVHNDWFHAMNWLKNNTPEDSVIASWWDYGYWITTLSDRTTIIDNSTLIDWQIKKMAYSLITTPENSWHILNSHHSEDISEYMGDETILAFGGTLESEFNKNYLETYGTQCEQIFKNEAQKLGVGEKSCNPITKGMDADYILIFIGSERFSIPTTNDFLYTLDGGADERKKAWFMRISNHSLGDFLESDNDTPKSNFMENSTLGKLIPFSIFKYVEPGTDKIYDDYRPGFIPVYYKDIKFDDPVNDPFYLVYASPSFYNDIPGAMTSVLIYKINPDYQP
tara:strand:- start:549 stop:2825 length:2277 start_codon:yes stop_codon:yes gene_type:complete